MMMRMMMVIRVGRIWRSDTVSAEATDWKLKAAHPSPNAIILRGGQDDHHEGDQDDHHEEDRDDHHEKDQEDHHEEYQDNHHEDDQDDHHEDDQDDHHKVNLQGVPKKSYLQNAAGCCWSKEERGRWPFSEEGREDHLKWNNIVGKVQRKKSLLTYLGHRDHPRFPIVKIIKGSIIVTSNIFSTPTFPHYTL